MPSRQVWAVALACVAAAACAGVALVGSGAGDASSVLLQRRVVEYRAQPARQQRLRQQPSYQGLPVAVATPLPAARPAARRHRQAPRAGGPDPAAPKQLNAPRIPPKTETEKQALMRARVEAKQAYLKTYNMAVKAENAAESQERKDRAARQKHEMQRHKLYGALKNRADKKEGWVKLQREMGMIMDGVDGLHYRGYKH